ncbi:MAG: biotin synthase BioB [Nitrospirota bacterium]
MNAIERLRDKILAGDTVSKDKVYDLIEIEEDINELFCAADKIRKRFKGDLIDLCSVVNAKSGICLENCSFCAQSSISTAFIEKYNLIPIEKIIDAARDAMKNGAMRFCISTSGRGIENEEELKNICEGIRRIKDLGLYSCATLGILSNEEFIALKEAGLDRFHHNLETSESFFPEICTTHRWKEKVETIIRAKEAGLSVCCGGILGMGEDIRDRIDMAFAIHGLDIDSVPLNFLMPIQGTPLEHITPLSPMETLKTIAIFRFILPDKDIRICGGRHTFLRDLHSFIFYCGADSMMIGNYLTLMGRDPVRDIQMIKDFGYNIREI